MRSECVAPAHAAADLLRLQQAGTCAAENVALASQVTNVAAAFGADNNGISLRLPNLVNANGDATVQGELTFGIATQSDNPLPATGLTVLAADGNGEFTTTYNGMPLPSLIDSGNADYAFDDATLPVCDTGSFIGYYCPAVAPQNLSAIVAGAGVGRRRAARSILPFLIPTASSWAPPHMADLPAVAAPRGSAGVCRSSSAGPCISDSRSGPVAPSPDPTTLTERGAQPVPDS